MTHAWKCLRGLVIPASLPAKNDCRAPEAERGLLLLRPRPLRFQRGDALLQFLEPGAGALQHLALRVEFIAARQVELAEVGAQHGSEVVLQVFAQPTGTGCEPWRKPLHQAA